MQTRVSKVEEDIPKKNKIINFYNKSKEVTKKLCLGLAECFIYDIKT